MTKDLQTLEQPFQELLQQYEILRRKKNRSASQMTIRVYFYVAIAALCQNNQFRKKYNELGQSLAALFVVVYILMIKKRVSKEVYCVNGHLVI